MFNISWNRSDAIRAVWSFIFGAIAYFGLVQTEVLEGTIDWKTLLVGACVAGLSAVKNLVLRDGTVLKG